jgi:hypothetical protein
MMRIKMLHDHKRHARFGGKWRKRSIAASKPPADPPMPTIGQARFGGAFRSRFSSWAILIATPFCRSFLFARRLLSISLFALRPCAICTLGAPAHHTSCDCEVEPVVFNALCKRLRLCS